MLSCLTDRSGFIIGQPWKHAWLWFGPYSVTTATYLKHYRYGLHLYWSWFIISERSDVMQYILSHIKSTKKTIIIGQFWFRFIPLLNITRWIWGQIFELYTVLWLMTQPSNLFMSIFCYCWRNHIIYFFSFLMVRQWNIVSLHLRSTQILEDECLHYLEHSSANSFIGTGTSPYKSAVYSFTRYH